jgi:hypothetical protein
MTAAFLPRGLRVTLSLLLLSALGLRLSVKQQRSLSSLQQHYQDITEAILMENKNHVIVQKETSQQRERVKFIHTGASEQEIADFFALPDDDEPVPMMEPIWSCANNNKNDKNNDNGRAGRRQEKLLVHILPRSGGMTFRALLKGYSMVCNTSLAIVSKCLFLGREYMERGDVQNNWSNGLDTIQEGKSCVLESATNRSGQVIPPLTDGRLNTDFLVEHDLDIVAGQFPMGADEFWIANRSKVPARNIVMFRDPLERFVSQFMRIHKLSSLDDTIQLMEETVKEKVSSDQFYEVYSRMLIRPDQRDWVQQERVSWTSEQRLNLTIKNLMESNAVIGILERMDTTVDLLRYVLDKDRQVPDVAFDYFGSTKLRSRLGELYGNSTQTVLERINSSTDRLLRELLHEYLYYERRIYDWAVRRHKQQVQSISQWKEDSIPRTNQQRILPRRIRQSE